MIVVELLVHAGTLAMAARLDCRKTSTNCTHVQKLNLEKIRSFVDATGVQVVSVLTVCNAISNFSNGVPQQPRHLHARRRGEDVRPRILLRGRGRQAKVRVQSTGRVQSRCRVGYAGAQRRRRSWHW